MLHPELEELIKYHEDRLSKEEKAALEEHLEVCEMCGRYVVYMVDDPDALED